MLTKKFSVIVFCVFAALIIGATLFYQPGWGLMDDINNQNVSQSFWNGEHSFMDETKIDFGRGRFRPVYTLWVFFGYGLGNPLLLYVLIAILNLSVLLVWGASARLLLDDKDETGIVFKYIYPVTFFLFTPFWNNFMYISVQEKFVYIFGGLAFYFVIRAYRRENVYYYLWGFCMAILALLGKEMAVSFLLAFAIYGFIDFFILKTNRKLSWIVMLTSGVTAVSYYVVIKKIIKGYSQSYADNLSVMTIIQKVFAAGFVIKGVFVLAALFFIVYALRAVLKHNKIINNEYLLFPLGVMLYLVILAPWGYRTYLLAPIAPLVMLVFMPLVQFVLRQNRWIANGCIMAMVFLSCIAVYFVHVPNIEKMANIQKAVTYMKTVTSKSPRFFYPEPFEESAANLKTYTQQDLVYIKKNDLQRAMLSEGENYLVYDIQAGSVQYQDLSIGELVYSNSTWRIYEILPLDEGSGVFKPEFKLNGSQKFKAFLKNI